MCLPPEAHKKLLLLRSFSFIPRILKVLFPSSTFVSDVSLDSSVFSVQYVYVTGSLVSDILELISSSLIGNLTIKPLAVD